MDQLIEIAVFTSYFIYFIATGVGVYMALSAILAMPKLGETQSMMNQEVTAASLITRFLFGVLLATSNLVAVGTALSLGASSSQAVDPYTVLNYSELASSASTEALKFAALVKSLSRAVGAYSLTSGLKHGGNINHPTENVRKSARMRLIWGVLSGVVFIFPEFIMSIVAHYNSSFSAIADLFNQVL
jgi:hypothetical protein